VWQAFPLHPLWAALTRRIAPAARSAGVTETGIDTRTPSPTTEQKKAATVRLLDVFFCWSTCTATRTQH